MKLYAIFLIIICLNPLIAKENQYSIMLESGERKGVLKYKAIHASIEVIVLSSDKGSTWHSEDLTVYFRNKEKSELFTRTYHIPFTSGNRQFKCEVKDNELIITARLDENSKFSHIRTLLLPIEPHK